MRVEEIGDCKLFLGDCLEMLPSLDRVDLILTDPPYGIGISSNPIRQAHDKMNWDDQAPPQWVFDMMQEKAEKLIIWGGNYFNLPPSQAFFVWDKMQPEDFSLAMCEQAWCSFKKPAKIYRQSVKSYKKEHPTQKPVQLMEWCIKYAGDPKIVCDPFMGSGTTGVACAGLGIGFLGIEKEQKYFDVACKRVEAAYSQRRLFS